MQEPDIICIVGPTASGKSSLAIQIAGDLGGEIISADSMQVYRHMDIGTAKPSLKEQGEIRHHLIDVAEPDENFNASNFRKLASAAIKEIRSRGKRVIVAGGTGLYIRALTKGLVDTPSGDPLLRQRLKDEADRLGREHLHNKLRELDPSAAKAIHPNNSVRIIRAIEVATNSGKTMSEHQRQHSFADSPYNVIMFGIDIERDLLYDRINERVDKMIEAGLKKEVERLLAMGYSRDLKSMRSVGYKEMCAHIIDGLAIEEAVELIKRDSRRYAKRQMTWFRKEDVTWGTAGRLKKLAEDGMHK
ncbi:MAG: tRNA (adenosine(37)-N6)-dimethylallyltransferase MiaA [bacterium]|nr:tRNA (adenosine(37)-N6)-dimethylallyltransferase MiaA [bacterium]